MLVLLHNLHGLLLLYIDLYYYMFTCRIVLFYNLLFYQLHAIHYANVRTIMLLLAQIAQYCKRGEGLGAGGPPPKIPRIGFTFAQIQ